MVGILQWLKRKKKALINNFLMPAVGSNPYFLLLFSRYSDLEIRFQSKKKKLKYKEIQNLTKRVLSSFLLEKSHRIKRRTEQFSTVHWKTVLLYILEKEDFASKSGSCYSKSQYKHCISWDMGKMRGGSNQKTNIQETPP